jgi:putative nucleotidyltransferase with HDIG domain
MANILIVEDDEFFRPALRGILESQGHKVTEAENGKIAREIIQATAHFDVILSDIQMPFLTGVELLEWVKTNKPCPFILMTGFALVMETAKAHDLGADDFLAKPFNQKELLEAIKKQVQVETPPQVPETPVEYCKVSLDEFVSSSKLMFDVFVQLGNKHIKIGHRGDDIPRERINHYKEKGLKFLYVLKEDFKQLVEFNLQVMKVVKSSTNLSREKKLGFLKYTGEIILETAYMNGVDKDSFDDAKEFLTAAMDVLTDQEEVLGLLDILNSHANYLYAHSLCVSTYSVMIAKKLGWTTASTLFKVSICGLFHDIGKKEIPREILDKPRALLSLKERSLIETHPGRGSEILMSMPAVPSEAAQVAFEHHEDSLGSGYPRRISKREMHPFTHVIRVANIFAEHVLTNATRPGMAPAAAIQHMQTHFAALMDPPAFKALCTLFPIDQKKTA